MKTRSIMLAAALAVMGLFTLAARAEDATSRPGGEKPRGPEGIQKILADLNLTADQEAKVKGIMDTQRQAMENFRKEHGEELKSLETKLKAAREAKTEPDKADMEAMKKLRDQQNDLRENLMKQLGEVLTKEQMEKFRENMPKMGGAGGGPLAGLGQLDLTDAQKEKAKAIMEEARKTAEQATTPADKRAAMEAAIAKIKSEVLTPEQAKKLEEFQKDHPRGEGRGPKGDKPEGKGGDAK